MSDGGKGSKQRPTNHSAFSEGMDRIFGGKNMDPYATAEESEALIQKDTRSAAQKQLDQYLEERGVSEQGAEAYPILYQFAIDLIESTSRNKGGA